MSRWPNKYVIGLTGNIAVGKSVVRQMLQHSGAYTIDADSLAHQAMMPGAPAYKPVVETFGQVVVSADGRINRQALGAIVFANPELLRKLESITHPIIRQAVNVLVSRSKQPIVVIEAIKLLEGELAEAVDAVWVVDAKPQTQYRRLVGKRKMSEDDAKQRVLSQNAQAEKLKKATVVINNDGDVESTWKQVQQHWAAIRQQLKASASAAPAPSAPSAAAAPASAPAPAATQAPAPAIPAEDGSENGHIEVSGIIVKRGMPGNAQAIADFITQASGQTTARMDVMMSFGQKSFLIAQDDAEKTLGIVGWTVENLVTRMDDLHLIKGDAVPTILHAIIIAVEEASKELQSEVGFIFIDSSSQPVIIETLHEHDYKTITLPEIKIPAWREAVEEAISERPMLVLWKQLRKDRVLQPI